MKTKGVLGVRPNRLRTRRQTWQRRPRGSAVPDGLRPAEPTHTIHAEPLTLPYPWPARREASLAGQPDESQKLSDSPPRDSPVYNCGGPGQRVCRGGDDVPDAPHRDRRYAMRDRLARCTTHEQFKPRIVDCGTPMHGQARIAVKAGRAYPTGLASCGSVLCPVCGPTIGQKRAGEFTAAIGGWQAKGPDHDAWFVVLNARNSPDLSLTAGVDRILKGFHQLGNRKAWRRLKAKYGLHYIRVVDHTYGENGWNVHLNLTLATVSGPDDAAMADILMTLRKLWPDVMARLGFEADPSVSVHVKQIEAGAADDFGGYMAKSSAWTIGAELVRPDLKRGKGRTYEQIVIDYDAAVLEVKALWKRRQYGERVTLDDIAPVQERADRDLALIREYHDAMYGRRRHSWSEGFRELVGLAKQEARDEDVAAAEPRGGSPVAFIDGKVYYTMLRRRQVATMLAAAERDGIEGIRVYVIDELGYPPSRITDPPYPPGRLVAV